MSIAQRYAVYLTIPTEHKPAGSVVNIITWDGASPWDPASGQAIMADPEGFYPIGSTIPQARTEQSS